MDLFSGIGGLSLALAPWVRPIAYCENDRYAQAVLLSRMRSGGLTTAGIWDDITTLLPSMLPRHEIDIIYGGFPCQDASVAGLKKGLGGSRTRLFWEIARLANEIKPEFVFLENVPGITANGLDEIAHSLSALGYDCRWEVVPAYQDATLFEGQRWFCLAKAKSKRIQTRPWEKCSTNAPAESFNVCPLLSPIWGTDSCYMARMDDGLPARVDRISALGNAVVPTQAREAFMHLMGLDSTHESEKD